MPNMTAVGETNPKAAAIDVATPQVPQTAEGIGFVVAQTAIENQLPWAADFRCGSVGGGRRRDLRRAKESLWGISRNRNDLRTTE